jgi:hypothetical protein
MAASSSLSGEEWNERIHWPALFKWAESVHQLFSNERNPSTSSFQLSGCNDPFFHMSWANKYLVISYPTGIWELHFRSDELNCTYELKCRPQKYVGYDKTRFSVTPAHMKRAGHPLPLSSKERVTRSRLAQKSWLPTPARLKRAKIFN